eukprot:TRINITY_DN2348_c0_g1_i1.p1 TRINITY_DN2348_c0_g1~~TRINITY_DN2348_c0_g1_i1.p1  ORF type:complete len:404 (+),score=62.13 TRINITY_DN2348_c0_g1_i1:30-1241(+)
MLTATGQPALPMEVGTAFGAPTPDSFIFPTGPKKSARSSRLIICALVCCLILCCITALCFLAWAIVFNVLYSTDGHHSGDAPAVPTEPLGFSLSGSGLLIFYHVGALSALLDLGLVQPRGVTPLAGLSGGAITSLMTCAGMSPMEIFGALTNALANAKADPAAYDGLAAMLRKDILPRIPADAWKVCSGRVRVGMTVLDPGSTRLNDQSPHVVDHFESRADLEAALVATSFLFCVSGPTPHTFFRGYPVIDGGYSTSMSDVCHPGVNRCVRVSAFYNERHMTPEANCSVSINSCPGDRSPRRPPFGSVSALPYPQAPSQQPSACTQDLLEPSFFLPGLGDIYPGRSAASRAYVSEAEWWAHAVTPNATFDAEQGRADTIQWAVESGIPGAAALVGSSGPWMQQ